MNIELNLFKVEMILQSPITDGGKILVIINVDNFASFQN